MSADDPISRIFTPEEIAEIEAFETEDETPTPPKEKKNMPQPIHPGASREERLAALPQYRRDPRGVSLEKRLTRLSESAMTTLSELDEMLDSCADAFEAAFERDDSRAASQDRIASTAKAHREASRRR